MKAGKSAQIQPKSQLSQKIFWGWVGFQKPYVIFRVGHGKCLRPLTRWVGGVKKGQKYAYVIFEWPLTQCHFECVPISRNKALYVCGKSSFFIILIDA